MKNYIISLLAALCWAMPLMGVTVRNTTENNAFLTATIPGQTTSTTVTLQPHMRQQIEIPQNIAQMNITMGSVVPAHKQMTPIQPLKGSHGWIFIGRNAEGHALYAPLLALKEIERPLEGASASFALIDGMITRIDSFTESKNASDQSNTTLSPAIYAKDIDPKSYIMVVRDKKLIARLYAPQVVRAATAQWYKAQNK